MAELRQLRHFKNILHVINSWYYLNDKVEYNMILFMSE